jgi:hypothetical protein
VNGTYDFTRFNIRELWVADLQPQSRRDRAHRTCAHAGPGTAAILQRHGSFRRCQCL